jgi:hypothetical protein
MVSPPREVPLGKASSYRLRLKAQTHSNIVRVASNYTGVSVTGESVQLNWRGDSDPPGPGLAAGREDQNLHSANFKKPEVRSHQFFKFM